MATQKCCTIFVVRLADQQIPRNNEDWHHIPNKGVTILDTDTELHLQNNCKLLTKKRYTTKDK